MTTLPAEDAGIAQFTVDSKGLFFVAAASALHADQTLFQSMQYASHVEYYSVTTASRRDSADIPLCNCGTDKLSPNGSVLACVTNDGTLKLFDVQARRSILTRQFAKLFPIYGPGYNSFPIAMDGHPGDAMVNFSFDGRYLLASPYGGVGHSVIVAVSDGSIVRVPGYLARNFDPSFAFISPDLLISSKGWPTFARMVPAV